MGQNPVNPQPGQPQFPQSGGSGPSQSGFGSPSGPGYGPQTPNPVPGYGPSGPQQAPVYPQQPGGTAPTVPFPAQPSGGSPYGAPAPSPYSAPQPGPYGPPPSAPYPTPGIPAPAPRPAKSRKGLLIGLGIVAAVLLLVVVGAVVVITRLNADAANTEPDKAIKSTTALKGYLTALAAGDADKAKLYAMNPPADSPLLTNDFLKASLAKNAITEVTVEAKTDYGTTSYTSASYRIGTTLVQGNYELTKVGKIWKLNTVATSLKRPTSWGKLPVTVNGTTAPADTLLLFPGIYELGTGTSFLEFATPSFTVKEPSDYVSGIAGTGPALSAKGKQSMIAASQEWLAACLAAQDTNPKGCGMNTPLPNGATLAPGSMKRTVTSAGTPFATATPRVSLSDPLKITMTSYVAVALEAKDTAGKSYEGSSSISSATGTIAGEKITVVFDE